MNTNDVAFYFLSGVIGLGIWAWIIYSIIRNASKANENIFYQKRIFRMLAEIAYKSGVDAADIHAIKRDAPTKREQKIDLSAKKS